jgi:hypothetical protein
MIPDSSNRPIPAKTLAAKMKKARNFALPTLQAQLEAEPRLEELLWTLQWCSFSENYPGGLARFTRDFLEDSADLLGTKRMRECVAKSETFTPSIAREIYRELPCEVREEMGYCDADVEDWDDRSWPFSARNPWKDPHVLYLRSFGEHEEAESLVRQRLVRQQERTCEVEPHREERRRCEEGVLATTDLGTFQQPCLAHAQTGLAAYLRNLCECEYVHFSATAKNEDDRPAGRPPWYFADVALALIRFIERRKARIFSAIAETAISREMRTWLELARVQRRAVRVIGSSRFGKSEFGKAWCLASPGLARLVTVPDSNSMPDLLRAVAMNLGIEPWQTTARLRGEIEFVLEHSGIFVVFDEAHRLFPSQFSRTTAPARLEWVRHNVMDAGLGCAFIATRQGYETARRKYLGKTGYAIEQFEERILKTVALPEELEESDLLRIARIHLPNLADDYHAHVVDKVLLARRSFVSDLEKVATLSRHFATAARKASPGLAEINAALAEILPPAEPESGSPKSQRPTPAPLAAPPQRPCRSREEPLRDTFPAPAPESPRRITFDQLTPEESPLGTPV